MNRLSGKAIAVALALLFFLLASGASVALVIHGVQSFRSGESLTVSQELEQAKAQRELKKEEKALKKTTEKSTTQKSTKKTTTKKTEAKPSTTKSTTAKKTTATKSATKKTTKATTKKSSAKPSATKKSATKKSTTKKATTKKATTKRSATKKSTGTVSSGSKVIYLTFDDGPYQYTEKLLGVLEKYDVKATFFVTNAYPGYQDLIGKEYRAGHGVAVHTYSHDYSKVYASDAAYWADFEKMNDIVEKQTGQRSIMFRFPGGSSNAVSRKYSTGIMSRLVKQSREKGLVYYDWNVTSGDAGETTSSEQVYKNIIHGVQQQDRSIVLCHDVKSYTVNAMDKTIAWCLDHGYSFRVLTPNGYTVHHGVNN